MLSYCTTMKQEDRGEFSKRFIRDVAQCLKVCRASHHGGRIIIGAREECGTCIALDAANTTNTAITQRSADWLGLPSVVCLGQKYVEDETRAAHGCLGASMKAWPVSGST